MNNPHLYEKSNVQPRSDFNYVSKNYLNKLKFNDYCTVMDIGCGPGNITRESLLQLLPKNANSVVGVDISPEMINYARENYQTDPKLYFRELDILTDNIPREYCEAFDHIFSFYCLHLIKDQWQAIKNIHYMLKPEGDIFLTFIGKNILFEFYKYLEDEDKWKPYLINYKQKITPTQTCDNPVEYFENLLKEANFNVNYCISEDRNLTHSKQDWIGIVTAVKISEIPKHLDEDFIFEFFNFLRRHNLIDTNEDGEEQVHHKYTLFVVHATKKNEKR